MSSHRNMPPRRPTLLVILDGFGINPSKINNAIASAHTPRLDHYFERYPSTQLEASGLAVGLPEGQMGNSEVGHLTLGSGSVMRQYLVMIDDAIADGSFYANPVFINAASRAKQRGRPLHLLGLVSEGGVHSHVNHVYALIELCRRMGVKPLLHMITDGRDTAPQAAINYVSLLETALARVGGAVATVSGRYYAMDRDNRWTRTEAAWRAIVKGDGQRAPNLRRAIQNAYDDGVGDEFIRPTVLPQATQIIADDEVIFFNFRNDRTRQLTQALTASEFKEFSRPDYSPVTVSCMTCYDETFNLPFAFKQDKPETTLADTLFHAGLSQFHCAETEKYAHVTYFFNGGSDTPHAYETYQIIPSPKVSTYDLKPEMSAPQVADAVIKAMRDEKYAFIVVNFANGDMVGHTAVREAVIKAVEALDHEVGRVLDAAAEEGYSVIVTADHGNCEQLVDPETGEPHTQHTTNPVPCLIIDQIRWQLSATGGLKDIAPTVLQLMGLTKPGAMNGKSLLIKPADKADRAA